MRPTKILLEVVAFCVLTAMCVAIGMVLISQVQFYRSEDYRTDQAARFRFLCYRQTEKEQAVANTSVGISQLMEMARGHVMRPDLYGKIDQFLLCANLTKVGFSGFEIEGLPRNDTRERLFAREAIQSEIVNLKRLTRLYPLFPTEIENEVNVQLTNLLKKSEKPEDLTAENIASTEYWLLITGADQSEEAAKDQVKDTQKAINTLVRGSGVVGEAQIYMIRSWRRTVVRFMDEASARDALKKLSPDLDYGAYVRSENKWCSKVVPMGNVGGIETSRCEQ